MPQVASHERAPAMTLAAALAAGIGCERALNLDWAIWLAGCVLALCALVVVQCRGQQRWAAIAAALLFVGLGGARQHHFWSLRPANALRQYAAEKPRLVELLGVVSAPVEILPASDDPLTPEWMRLNRSLVEMEAEHLAAADAPIPVAGRLRLEVTGDLLHVRAGDRVRVLGTLSLPARPRNPGAIDFAAWLRGRGVDCVLRCDHPDAVQVLHSATGLRPTLACWRGRLREIGLAAMRRHLNAAHVPVAASLLLGDRTGMTDEITDAFVQSGTMHLLAISGLHVGLLAGMLYLVCRLLKLAPTSTGLVVLITILAYAFITDHRPPVVRSAILAAMVVLAGLGRRRSDPMNTLACSALIVLLWNPADLFDVGAQLSFLAVAGIISGARLTALLREKIRDPLRREQSPGERLLWAVGGYAGDAYAVTAAIWLFTLPLTLARFHLASPIGFLLNVILVPYSALLLGAGFAFLGCGVLLPAAAAVPGAVFDVLLSVLLGIVSWSAATPLGHFSVAGPWGWWVGGWYAALAAATGIVRLPVAPRRAWQCMGAWTVIGLAIAQWPDGNDELRCTVLSVGHGGAILVELPGGGTILYDAGTFGAPERAERVVQNALWAAGRSRIDALIISHADMDHYNGASGLLKSVPIARMLLSPAAVDVGQAGIARLCEEAGRAGTDIRLVWRGDVLRAAPGVEMTVLHPPASHRDEDDNASSIVLRVRYAGRTLLLTGDLEGAGLAELMQQPGQPVDVLLSPHHGARQANPPELGAWASPKFVIASTGDPDRTDTLRDVYGPDCGVLSTADAGAVSITIARDGTLSLASFLSQ